MIKYLFFLVCLVFTSLLYATEEKKIYQAGYFETGEYSTYTEVFNALKDALEEQHWWDRLSFPKEAKFSPGRNKTTVEWEDAARKILARKDLDIIFVLGTDANRAIVKVNKELIQSGQFPTRIFGMSVTDAVKAGIVLNEEDSGMDNYTVYVSPSGLHEQMFRIFYGETGLQRLGLLYRTGNESSTLLEDAYNVANVKGFTILEEKIEKEDTESCFKGLTHLIEQNMDAFFIPSLDCFDWQKSDVQKIFNLLINNHILTFSRWGASAVKSGVLMGLSSTGNLKQLGKTLATKLVKILEEDAVPRSLPMAIDFPPQIALNLYVAKKVKFQPSFDLLGACEDIYEEITLPKKRLVK